MCSFHHCLERGTSMSENQTMLVFCSSHVLFICLCQGVGGGLFLQSFHTCKMPWKTQLQLWLWLSWSHLYTSSQCPCILPRILVSCSTVCAFPSYTSGGPGAPDWPMPFSFLPCFISYTWELNTLALRGFCSQRAASSFQFLESSVPGGAIH